MTIWALSDPHLAFGVPSKTMEAFGPAWHEYAEKIAANWKQLVSVDDLVLIPGDISWAMRPNEAKADLDWIDALPGSKILLKGNHDYWWTSASQLAKIMPPSIRFIQNNALTWNGIAIGGSRLWDTPEYGFSPYITFRENPLAKKKPTEELSKQKEEEERIFVRELERLKLSLSQLDPKAKVKIALTHYPPIGADLLPSRASQILEHFQIDYCVFGHLHNVKEGALPFGNARGVEYLFTSCDYIHFTPIRVWP
jgi:uncharacterized protein